MKVSEIFLSIEGEGSRAGLPCVFVRLHGCNLRCSYCDSMYAVEGCDYFEMSVDEIVSKVNSFGVGRVTITGGEPLIHKDVLNLIETLCKSNEVNVETNGAVSISSITSIPAHSEGKLIVTMDWKSYSSNMSHKMIEDNLRLLSSKDVLKFVVGTFEDLQQMFDLLKDNELLCNIYVSPVFGEIEPCDIVKYILDNGLFSCHVQLQLHKFIWDKDKRGV